MHSWCCGVLKFHNSCCCHCWHMHTHADCPSTPDHPGQASLHSSGLRQHSPPVLAGAAAFPSAAAAAAADTPTAPAAINPEAIAAALQAYQSPLRRCTVAVKVRHSLSMVVLYLEQRLICGGFLAPKMVMTAARMLMCVCQPSDALLSSVL